MSPLAISSRPSAARRGKTEGASPGCCCCRRSTCQYPNLFYAQAGKAEVLIDKPKTSVNHEGRGTLRSRSIRPSRTAWNRRSRLPVIRYRATLAGRSIDLRALADRIQASAPSPVLSEPSSAQQAGSAEPDAVAQTTPPPQSALQPASQQQGQAQPANNPPKVDKSAPRYFASRGDKVRLQCQYRSNTWGNRGAIPSGHAFWMMADLAGWPPIRWKYGLTIRTGPKHQMGGNNGPIYGTRRFVERYCDRHS
jgi:hypothetical protein